jgi:hypothetical protein
MKRRALWSRWSASGASVLIGLIWLRNLGSIPPPAGADPIIRSLSFLDGDKRMDFHVASNYPGLDGYELQAARCIEHAEMMLQLGQGPITCEETAYLRARAAPV